MTLALGFEECFPIGYKKSPLMPDSPALTVMEALEGGAVRIAITGVSTLFIVIGRNQLQHN